MSDTSPSDLASWLQQLDQALQPASHEQNVSDRNAERLIYVLQLFSRQPTALLTVEPCIGKPLKNGGYAKIKSLSEHLNVNTASSLSLQDRQILHWLEFSRKQFSEELLPNNFPLEGKNGAILLQQIVETGRSCWVSLNSATLKMGQPRQAVLTWEMEPNGLQRLCCRITGGGYSVLLLTPPWYVDHTRNECGPLETGLDPGVAAALLAAPALKPEQIKQVYAALTKRLTATPAPLPRTFSSERILEITPIPQLRLFSAVVPVSAKFTKDDNHTLEIKLPLAELTFGYDQTSVGLDDTKDSVSYVSGKELISITRNKAFERTALQQLQTTGVQRLKKVLSHPPAHLLHCFLIDGENNAEAIANFSLDQLPKLEEAGWKIHIESDYPYHFIDEQAAEWYSAVEESPSQQWFNLELGITVQGQRINLLPLLLQILDRNFSKFTPAAIDTIPDSTKLIAELPDGRLLPLPIKRIRNILRVLVELYDAHSLDRNQHLALSKLRAAQLVELEKTLGVKHFRWLGGEQLRKLGERLSNFQGLEEAVVPDGFQATLRPYQQEGINWLQFLREYDLAGILADDMGLGKTVQALAHLWIEKISGRMDKPCLVIAPTSLMGNWRMEAQRFTPELTVLVLHGEDRKPHFKQIQNYDLILTTYPLLNRDQKFLLAQQYHLLILDEAQVIKNPKAKATQIIYQIQARHRLCLTGTPMENHLGDLWSLFHFLLPGFLGDIKQFQRTFRKPIEKFQDADRRASLAHRVAPFLLRRTKEKVMSELPAKIDIVRNIELEGVQRDLYESIRIAMQLKVTQAIQEKGLASSQIIILDALLKLRQVCCDPRLVKLDSSKKVAAGSAKLELLFDMLPSLIEEGRRVLLFSQFTSMLTLIEEELTKFPFEYVKLTGQTKDRTTPIERFQRGEVPLFLISLKAGGTGLNLTAADVVIHYDPWWNPAVENQATDRAHRIGQDKTVFVYKLVTTGTVEEKIIALQDKKRSLFEGLFLGDGTGKTQLALEDLQDLFSPLV